MFEDETLVLSRTIPAIGAENVDGKIRLGLMSQLGAGTILRVCGYGFNERTVCVKTNGCVYFVFREDIQKMTSPATFSDWGRK